MTRRRARTFTISLIKSDLTDPDEIIDGDFEHVEPVIVDGTEIGQLYIRRSFRAPPKWSALFDNLVDPAVFGVSSVPGALLLLDAAERKFAVTFGLGWALLSLEAWEEQFGLRVALNSIDAAAIKSLDKKNFEAVSTQTREQASRERDFSEFGLDVDQDLLSSVTGVPRDKAWGERMTGKHSLKVSTYKGIQDLPELCKAYFARYQDKAYEQRFKWIDQIREIANPELVGALNVELVAKLAGRPEQPDRCWLAAPDILEWADVGGFKFRTAKSAEVYSDIFWKDFYYEIGDDEISLETLKRHYVTLVDGNGTSRDRWSVYKCINCEIERDGKMFLLNGGKWFEVELEFVNKVNSYVAAIPRADLKLIPYDHQREDAYLLDATETLGERCVCMDQIMIPYGGGHSTVEFCDLFVDGSHIVHVKRYGAASTLSHLFAQGVNSGRLFVSDAEFRGLVDGRLPEEFKLDDPNQRIIPEDYEIVYAVISSQEGEDLTLPFFSRISLQNAAQLLKGYGFRVAIMKITALE